MKLENVVAGALWLSLAGWAMPGPAYGQGTTATRAAQVSTAGAAAGNLVRVFLDCNQCDGEHLRQNVGFVDYVRDRADADFHVLVTTQSTGGGGLSWIVQFIGIGAFQEQDHRLAFDTPSATTADERRTAFARVFKLGLATVAAATSAAPQLDVTWTRPAAGASVEPRDPWNYWVFNINTSGNVNGERLSTSRSIFMNLSANRTTNTWKVTVNANGNSRSTSFMIDEGETIESRTHSWNVNGRMVKSLGTRWATGVTGSLSHSSFSNVDRAAGIAPAIEFNVFPYSESSARSLTVQYAVGVTMNKYAELTVFDRLNDAVPRHAALGSLNLRQPWGSMTVYSSVSQHLSHLDRYNAYVYGQADVRLFKGFSFNVFAEYSKINDQISLRKADASQEEVLLRLRQLATGYSYSVNFGISYRFGSIYNSIVNPRFNSTSF